MYPFQNKTEMKTKQNLKHKYKRTEQEINHGTEVPTARQKCYTR